MGNKPFYKRAWDFLGSRDLSVFIFVMGMTYFLILAIFATIIPLPWVENISKLLPYKLLYILFFINIVVCEIKWVPVIIRKCRRPKAPETEEEMERFWHKAEVGAYGSTPVQQSAASNIEKYLRRRGYKVQSSEVADSTLNTQHSTLLYAYKGRFSPIGNLLFHVSFLFLLVGVGLSILYRFDGVLPLAEGQGITEDVAEYASSVETENVAPPRVAFEVEKITPLFWKDVLLFMDLKADVVYGGGKGVIRLSQPLRMDGSLVTLTGLGVAPSYTLKDRDGNELDNGSISLKIFTPGSEDWFQIPNFPYRIKVSFYPDFEMRNGRAVSRSMNPVNPAFKIKVSNNAGKRRFEGLVRPGEEFSFDGYILSLYNIKYCGIFRVVYDMGSGWIWTAFVLMITGLIWRLTVYKKEVVVWRDGEGDMHIAGHSDYYRRLFVSKLKYMAEGR